MKDMRRIKMSIFPCPSLIWPLIKPVIVLCRDLKSVEL